MMHPIRENKNRSVEQPEQMIGEGEENTLNIRKYKEIVVINSLINTRKCLKYYTF